MSKKFVIVLFLMMLYTAVSCGADMKSLLKASLDSLYGEKNRPMVVCYGNFTYADKGMGSEFSFYLEKNLTMVLKNCPQFELFARDKLEQILEMQELALSDLFSEKDSIQMGNLKSIRAILSGRFFDAGSKVEVFLELLNVETGTVAGSAEAVIPKADIPGNISLAPRNYNDAVAVVDKLGNIHESEDENLIIKTWIKRGDGGTYVNGEELVVHFYANQDCYLKMYHIDVKGNMKLIFPNQYHTNNMVKKDMVYTIPDESYGFAFTLGAPFGTEFIKIVACTKQFKDVEESFKDLGKGSGELIKRGLSVTQRKAKLKEAMLSYTIIENNNK
jgi:hypothetical protein